MKAEYTEEEKRTLRMAVIDDAIQQIEAGNYQAKIRTYFNAGIEGGSLKQAASNEICVVCAIGSTIASFARQVEDVEEKDFATLFHFTSAGIMTARSRKLLNSIFTEKTIRAMEVAFEKDTGYMDRFIQDGREISEECKVSAATMYGKEVSDKHRLLAILNNMKRNDGELNLNDIEE